MAGSLDGPMIIGVAGWIVYLISLTGSRLASRTKKLADHPNHRSSHSRATSKLGGAAIIGGWLTGMFVVAVFAGVPQTAMSAALLCGLTAMALGVGFIDDKKDMPPLWKFAGQFAVAGLFVLAFGALQTAPIPFLGDLRLGGFGAFLTILWIVGFMNAYNFMDGANGLAAGAAVVGLSAFCVIASIGGDSFVAIAAFLLALATFGFMPANFRRGALFMGDSGSQSISFLIAGLAVIAANNSGGAINVMTLPVIFLPFLYDVTVTLLHRATRRKNILTAHREHLYQLMIRMGVSHKRVAIIYMTLTALSATAAVLMTALPPAQKWIAPAVLTVLFSIGAARIYARAHKADLLCAQKDDGGEDVDIGDLERRLEPIGQAAE